MWRSRYFEFGLIHVQIEMKPTQTKDETLLTFYESVRRQVKEDIKTGGQYRLAGEGVKQYAEELRQEMDRRRLQYSPIDWHH